jgi:MFS family permease
MPPAVPHPRERRVVPHQEGTVISQDAGVPSPPAASAPSTDPAQGRATFGQVFAVGEFRALWTAQILSVAGDQLARVALTLLVFRQTHSALLAAVTFAASVVPTFLGGILLSGLADRLPRRQVMIVCDLIRAGLVAVMALSGIPVAVLVALLFLVTLIGAPFSAARAALYPEILPEDRYVLGQAVTLTTLQFAQVVGFAAGGMIVGFFGVRTSLLIDVGTFLASALITRVWVQPRTASHAGPADDVASAAGLIAAIRLVFGDAKLRTPMLLGWLMAFYDAPEGVAAPLAASLGGGAVAVGLLLAALALGSSLGAIIFSRFVPPARRVRWMEPLAAAACATLILFAIHPALPAAIAILALSGLCDSYQVAASAAFIRAIPRAQRSQAFGIAQGGMSLGQGAAMILAGAAAQHYSPSLVVAVSGVVGVVAAVSIGLVPRLRSRIVRGRSRGQYWS